MKRRIVRQQTDCFFVFQESCNGKIGFFDDACFKHYLTWTRNCLLLHQVKLHAFSLLANRLYLLVTPRTVAGLDSLLEVLDRAYRDYYNGRFLRSGAIWKPATRSRLSGTEDLVLNYYRYIELAPVRERLVGSAGEYPWSSFCINAFGGQNQRDSLITPHASLRRATRGMANPFEVYREYVNQAARNWRSTRPDYRLV